MNMSLLRSIALDFATGLDDLRDQKHEIAFKTLNRAFDSIRLVSKEVHPAALIYICSISKAFMYEAAEEVAQQLLWFMAHLSETFHRPAHPFRTIPYSLLKAPSYMSIQLIDTILHNIRRVCEVDLHLLPLWAYLSRKVSTTPFCWAKQYGRHLHSGESIACCLRAANFDGKFRFMLYTTA